MKGRKIMFGVAAGVASTAIDGLCGLIAIHLYFKYLSESSAGVWMLFSTVAALLLLPQTGASLSIARFIAQSNPGNTGKSSFCLKKFGNINSLTKQITVLVLLAGLAAYALYLRKAFEANRLLVGGFEAWTFYLIGLVIGVGANSRFAILNGLGEVGWDKVCRIMVATLGFLLSWTSLRSGLGLPGLAVVFLAQNAANLLAAVLLLRFLGVRRSDKPVKAEKTDRPLLLETSKLLLMNAMGYVSINFGIFIIERRCGAEMVARYVPITRVAVLLTTVALLLPQMIYPYVAKAWAAGDYKTHRRLFLTPLILSTSCYCMAAFGIWLLSPIIMPIWLGPGRFLGRDVMGLVLLFNALYVATCALASPVMACLGNAFIVPAAFNTVLVLIALWFCTGWWGVSGVPLGMIIGSIVPMIWLSVRSFQLMLNQQPGKPVVV